MHLLVPTTDLPTSTTQRYLRFRRARRDTPRSAVVGTEHQHLGQSHVGRRTLSIPDEPAQGCGDGRPALPGPSGAAVQHAPAAILVADIGANPVGVRKPAVAAQLRWPQTAAVRADRRPTAQPRSGRTTRMRGHARHADQVRGLRGRDGGADRLPVLHLRPVPDRFDDRVFGGVHRRVASRRRDSRCGSPGPGGHGQQRLAAAGQEGCGEVRRRPQRRAHRRAPGRRSATSTWSAIATSNSSTVRARTQRLAAGGQIPVNRTAPALDLDLLLGGLKPRYPGPESARRQCAHLSADTGFPGSGRDPAVAVHQDDVVFEHVGRQQSNRAATDRQPQHRGRHGVQGRHPVLRRDRSPREACQRAVGRPQYHRRRHRLPSTTGTASLADLLSSARPPLSGTMDQLNRLAPLLDNDKDPSTPRCEAAQELSQAGAARRPRRHHPVLPVRD